MLCNIVCDLTQIVCWGDFMKKKGITLFLALGLALGSLGALPVLAGEAAEQGTGSVQETKLAAEKISDLAGSEKE